MQIVAETADQTAAGYTRPDYAKKFRCIGSACEDTCCSGWTIPVDERTLASYQSDPILQPFTLLFVLNPTPTPSQAARMPLTHGGQCAFLDDQKLCSIQQNFGVERLPASCSSYPREITQRFGVREAALNLSCPEAARITLLDPDLLGPAFLERNMALRMEAICHDAESVPDGYQPLLATREFCLLLLADRAHPLAQRLQRLGALSCALQSMADAAGLTPSLWVEQNRDTVARLLARILLRSCHAAEEGARATGARCTLHPPSHSTASRQLHFASEVLRQRLAESPVSPSFRNVLDEIERGLHIDFTDPVVGWPTIEAYTNASGAYLTPFLAEHPYLLENYIANHIFKYHYPFGRQPENTTDLNQNHMNLCTQVALLQTLLAGLAAYHRENFRLEHVIALVQTLARAVEHRRPTLDAMAALAVQHGLNNPAFMAGLLTLPS